MYDRSDVERLLTAFFHNAWDAARFSYDPRFDTDTDGTKRTQHVDGSAAAESRRATVNKAHSGTWLAEKIDLERALQYLPMSNVEMLLLELRFSRGTSYADLADLTQVSHPERILDRLVDALVDEMNTGNLRRNLEPTAK